MSVTTASSARTEPLQGWRMPRRMRQFLLTLHVIVSVGWIGIDVALLLLAASGITASDVAVARGLYGSMASISVLLTPVSFAALVTGILLGLGTHWGLARHWWVFIKLVLNVVLVAGHRVLTFRLLNAATKALALPSSTSIPGQVGGAPIVMTLCGALCVLLAAVVLSTYKPLGRTPWPKAI